MIASAAGLAVTLISIVVAWQQFGFLVTGRQDRTGSTIPEVTFYQFIFSHRTMNVSASCLVSGLLAFFICFHFAKQTVRTREQKNALCSKIVVTIIGALIMSAILATFYAMQAWGRH